MKKKFFNVKNIIIVIISCILIGASATGVAVFLKDRGEADAVQQGPIENLPVTGNNEENDNQIGESTNTNDENLTKPEQHKEKIEVTQQVEQQEEQQAQHFLKKKLLQE